MARSSNVWNGLALLSVVLATIAVLRTYPVLSQTFDEPIHIASGMEWIQHGSYMLNTENPPLARVAVALGPYLGGARLPVLPSWDPRVPSPPGAVRVGDRLLYRDDRYVRNLSQARIGVVPFLWLLAWVVWLWARGGRQDADTPRAAIAVVATMTLPSILAHSGLATTDVPFVALFVAVLYRLRRAVEEGTTGTVLFFALSLALAILSKFSMFLFFPAACVAFAAAYTLERRVSGVLADLRRIRPGKFIELSALMALTVALAVWGGYRFSFGPIADLPHRLGYGGTLERGGVLRWWATIGLPAPELWHGLLALLAHVRAGQPTYLLGQTGQFGFWDYYPVALAVKTPLPFLIFGTVGVGFALTRARGPGAWSYTGAALAALGVILACLTSTLNYGSRHVLVVYPLLAIAGAWGWRELTRQTFLQRTACVALASLLVWQTGVAIRTGPDYLPYFNELARDPGGIIIDSDLDWGQDFLRLGHFVRDHEIHQLHIAYFGTVLQCRHELGELLPLEPGVPTTGWIAISESYARATTTIALKRNPCDEHPTIPSTAQKNAYIWLRAYEPVARVGRSIRLYHIADK